jgi:serralysin
MPAAPSRRCLGADILVGLGGENAFIFNTALGRSNIDTIADYSVAEDQVRLDNAIFSNLAATEGNWLTADEFTIGGAAADAKDRIIYDGATGALFYDSDVAGAAPALQFATLGRRPGSPATSSSSSNETWAAAPTRPRP